MYLYYIDHIVIWLDFATCLAPLSFGAGLDGNKCLTMKCVLPLRAFIQ